MPIFTKGETSVLFAHVPKTGGSSLEKLFVANGYEMHYRDGDVGPHTMNSRRRCSPQHMDAGQLQAVFRLDAFDVVFMVAREPLARFRSEYLWRHEYAGASCDAASVDAWADEVLHEYAADEYVLDNHLRPQIEFLLPGAHTYRYEDGLDAIVADLNDRFALQLDGEPLHAQKGGSRAGFTSQEVEVSPDLARRLRTLYAMDYLHFDYPFDGTR